MMQLNINVNDADVDDAIALFEFIGGNTNRAQSIAINRSLPRIRNRNATSGLSITGAVSSQVRIGRREINTDLESIRANPQRLTGRVRVKADRMRGRLLSRYSTDTNIARSGPWTEAAPPIPPRGIRVRVKPGGEIKTLSNDHFYMVLPSSQRLAIARRRETPGPRGGMIEVLYGPSAPQVFGQETLARDIQPAAIDLYQFELLDAMRYLLVMQYPQE